MMRIYEMLSCQLAYRYNKFFNGLVKAVNFERDDQRHEFCVGSYVFDGGIDGSSDD